MATTYVIGVDIGTQGVKCSLFSLEGIAIASAFVPSRLHRPIPGVVEEDPEFQVEAVCRSIRECLAQAPEEAGANVVCLAIDGQMAGVIGIGKDGMAITPYDSWLDTRCAPYIAVMKDRAGQEITQKTGNPPSFNHGPKILWWKHEHSDVYARIAAFVQPGGYAAMRLCGLDASASFIDPTYLHFSGFADNPSGSWDTELVRMFAVDPGKLPRIVASASIVGTTSRSMTDLCGLSRPVPVAAGCGDTAASFLSCGATRPGICVDVAGTASVFAATTDVFRADTASNTLGCGASAVPGLWHPYAYIHGGGMNLEWFATEVVGRDPQDSNRFDDLIPKSLAPSMTDPLFIPHMEGRVSPSQPHLRGTFAGLSWTHSAKDLFVSILESVALEYGIYRKALLSMYPGTSVRELRITGGGARSCLWKEIKSAVLQVPVTRIGNDHGAPMGSALIAAHAVGVFPTLDSGVEAWVPLAESVEADVRLYEHYEKRLDRYERLLATMNDLYTQEM